MKSAKNAYERKTEILDVAENLFLTKGYQETTIIDILEKAGIAKGTFYYYFKSKEELMNTVILRVIDDDIVHAKIVANRGDLSVFNKIYKIFFHQKVRVGSRKETVISGFQNPNNAEMRQKSLILAVNHLSPVLAEVVAEGVGQGFFSTEYPRETIELLIVSGQILFDKAWFDWSENDLTARVNAFVTMMEKSLGAAKGSFEFMTKILTN